MATNETKPIAKAVQTARESEAPLKTEPRVASWLKIAEATNRVVHPTPTPIPNGAQKVERF